MYKKPHRVPGFCTGASREINQYPGWRSASFPRLGLGLIAKCFPNLYWKVDFSPQAQIVLYLLMVPTGSIQDRHITNKSLLTTRRDSQWRHPSLVYCSEGFGFLLLIFPWFPENLTAGWFRLGAEFVHGYLNVCFRVLESNRDGFLSAKSFMWIYFKELSSSHGFL